MENISNLASVLQNTFEQLISQFSAFVPRLIGCLVILLIGYFIGRTVATLLTNILHRIGVDKLGEKLNDISFVKQFKTEVKLSALISKAIYYFILLMFLTAATEVLGIQAITSLVMSLINFIPSLFAGAIMLYIGIMFAELLKNGVVSLCRSFNVPSAKLFGNVVFIFFIIITFISALAQIGINTSLLESSFIIIIGGVVIAFSLGYGIASKDLLANIISSLYSKDKYRLGQVIKVGDVKGEVVGIDSLSIAIKTSDSTVVIPMQMLQNSKVEIY